MSKTTQTIATNVLTYAAIEAMNVTELKAECKANGIHGYSRLTKNALQGLLYDVADEQAKARCIENIEWAEQMQQRLAEVAADAVKQPSKSVSAPEAPEYTKVEATERVAIITNAEGVGVCVTSLDSFAADLKFMGINDTRDYGLIPQTENEALRDAIVAKFEAMRGTDPEPTTAQATTTEQATETYEVAKARKLAEWGEELDGVNATIAALESATPDGINDYIHTNSELLKARKRRDQLEAVIAAFAPAPKVAADQVREAHKLVHAGELDPRITTFDTIAEAIEGVDNLITWEFEDCADDFDLRAIAEDITCERCGKLAVLPTYDDKSDQFDARALEQVVYSHYIGDDDPTDPTDGERDDEGGEATTDEPTAPIGWVDCDDEALDVWATTERGIYRIAEELPRSETRGYVHADTDEDAIARAAETLGGCGFLRINGEQMAYLTDADFDQRVITRDEMAEVWHALGIDGASALRAQLMRNSVVYFTDLLRDATQDEARRDRFRTTMSAVTCAIDCLVHDAATRAIADEAKPKRLVVTTRDMVDCGEPNTNDAEVGVIERDGCAYPVTRDEDGYRVDLGGAVGISDPLDFASDAEALEGIAAMLDAEDEPAPVTISVTFTATVDAIPTTCSACPFADCCDGRVASLTKRGGMEWTARAMKGRPKACPLTVA